MTNYAHKVRVIRNQGRLHDCEVVDFDGNVMCRLPITGVESAQTVDGGLGKTKLTLHSIRVEEIDLMPPTITDRRADA